MNEQATSVDTSSPPLLIVTDHAVDGREAVRELRLNRPQSRNALNSALLGQLLDALHKADSDERVRAIVLTGHGPVFCAGGDLKEFSGAPEAEARASMRERATLLAELLTAIPGLSLPVVAAVGGPAVGAGAALALTADMVVGAPSMSFTFPEYTDSVVPAIVMPALIHQAGKKLAFELLTQGRSLASAEALHFGLVNRIEEDEHVYGSAMAIARKWAAADADTAASTKQLFVSVCDLSLDEAVRAGLEVTTRTWRPKTLPGQ